MLVLWPQDEQGLIGVTNSINIKKRCLQCHIRRMQESLCKAIGQYRGANEVGPTKDGKESSSRDC